MEKSRVPKDEQDVEKAKKAFRIEQAVLSDERQDVAIRKPILKQKLGTIETLQA